MMQGGGGWPIGWNKGHLTRLTLLTWNEGWTRGDLDSLNLTTDELIILETGNGPINLGVSFHDSVHRGKFLVESQTF